MANLLKKYRAKIVWEGILKSLFLGLVCGSVAMALCILLSWFFGFKAGLWVGIALFAAVTAAVTPILYFVKFKPTARTVATRVDALGLEERILTMTQLEGDDSYIARMQREDARRALGSAGQMVKIALSAGLCVALSVALAVGFGSTAVGSLYSAGVIPSGMQLLSNTQPEQKTVYTVTYSVQQETGGKLCLWDDEWNTPETFEETVYELGEGESAPAIYALDGASYYFIGWSDGVTTRYRADGPFTKNTTIIALYSADPEEAAPQEDAIVDDSTSGDKPGPNSDRPGPNDNHNGPPDPNNTDSDGGGTHAENSQIVDGNTYYGDRYSDAYDGALDRLGSDDDIPDDLKGYISDYYDSIRKGGGEDSGDGGSEETP